MVNPLVSVESLRDDWLNDPSLSPADKDRLEALDDAQVQAAADAAFDAVADTFYALLDGARGTATRRLLAVRTATPVVGTGEGFYVVSESDPTTVFAGPFVSWEVANDAADELEGPDGPRTDIRMMAR